MREGGKEVGREGGGGGGGGGGGECEEEEGESVRREEGRWGGSVVQCNM